MFRIRSLLSACAGALVLALALATGPARAASPTWLEAQTPHFTIYSDGSEAVLRAYADKLEVLDAAFWETWGLQRPAGPVRKLPVYLVADAETFHKVSPGLPKNVAGFYNPSPGITFAMGLSDPKNDNVVLHEYAHHLMLQYFPGAYPAWLVEGYAAYFEGTDVDRNVVQLGRSTGHVNALTYANWIKLDELVSKRPSDFDGVMVSRFYGQAWLMTHYFLSDPARARQLTAYLAAVTAGQPSAKALQDATGLSPIALEKALIAYATRPLTIVQFKRAQFPPTTVEVRSLPPAQAAVLLDDLSVRSQSVEKEAGVAALGRIKAAAAPYADDPFAQRALARAEHYFGDRDAGEALIKRRLAADPKDVEALGIYADILMGEGDAIPARQAELYTQAGNVLAAAFRLDPNNYVTLAAFARSKRFEPGYPSDNTLTALLTAVKLAPQVEINRLYAADSLIGRRRYREAAVMLTPLANNPHASGGSKAAQAMLAKIPTEPAS